MSWSSSVVFKLGCSDICPSAWSLSEGFPGEGRALGNQLPNLQLPHVLFPEMNLLKSCLKDSFFPPIILFLLCKRKAHSSNNPFPTLQKKSTLFTHHSPTRVHCPEVWKPPELLPEGGSFERKAGAFQKETLRGGETLMASLFLGFFFPSLSSFLPSFLTVWIQKQDGSKGSHTNTFIWIKKWNKMFFSDRK